MKQQEVFIARVVGSILKSPGSVYSLYCGSKPDFTYGSLIGVPLSPSFISSDEIYTKQAIRKDT